LGDISLDEWQFAYDTAAEMGFTHGLVKLLLCYFVHDAESYFIRIHAYPIWDEIKQGDGAAAYLRDVLLGQYQDQVVRRRRLY
jgi:hypothetical protein